MDTLLMPPWRQSSSGRHEHDLNARKHFLPILALMSWTIPLLSAQGERPSYAFFNPSMSSLITFSIASATRLARPIGILHHIPEHRGRDFLPSDVAALG